MVQPGNYEAIYSNMPPFSLAQATEMVPAVGGRETALRRLLRGENESAVPSPEYDDFEASRPTINKKE